MWWLAVTYHPILSNVAPCVHSTALHTRLPAHKHTDTYPRALSWTRLHSRRLIGAQSQWDVRCVCSPPPAALASQSARASLPRCRQYWSGTAGAAAARTRRKIGPTNRVECEATTARREVTNESGAEEGGRGGSDRAGPRRLRTGRLPGWGGAKIDISTTKVRIEVWLRLINSEWMWFGLRCSFAWEIRNVSGFRFRLYSKTEEGF